MAIAYAPVDKMGVNLTQNDAAPAHEVGHVTVAKDPTYGEGEFIYVKFTGTVAAGDLVVFARYAATCVQSATAATKGYVGISMAAATTGTYGWVMIRGIHDAANVLSGATVGFTAYGSALTAGRVTSAVTANYILDGLNIVVTGNGSNVGAVELYWPSCTGR